MRNRWMVLGALVLPLAALAQEPGEEAGDKNALILAALELPAQAQALRDDGVAAEEVAEALNASEEKGLKAGEASELLGEAHNAAKEHGKLDNFGAFVRSQLEAGLRGQELAAAIRAEHETRAKGQGAQKAKPAPAAPKAPPVGEGKGKPMDVGSGESVKVIPEGAPAGKGAPEGKGKPMEGAAPAPSPAPATGASGTRPGGKQAQ